MFFQNTPLVWLFQSYWRDEAFSVILAQKPFFELINITARDFSPPLYYLILKIWIMLFGPTEVATRSLSVIAFIALTATLLTYFRKVEKLNFFEILIISITILLSPILTYYAFETRMYAWAAFFGTCSWLALFRKKTTYFVFISFLGLYTHYFQVLILFSQFIYLIISEFHRCKNKNRSECLETFFRTWGMPLFKIGLLFAPWVVFVASSHLASNSSFWIKRPSIELIVNTAAILTTGYERDFNITYALFGISVLIYILMLSSGIHSISKGGVRMSEYMKSEHFAYVLWFLFPATIVTILSIFGPSLYLPRYLIVSSPALFFFVASELKMKRYFISLLLITSILFQLKIYQDLQIKYRSKENLSTIFSEINSRTKSGDVLYLESELDYHLALHYFKYPNSVYIVGKPYSELPSYVGKAMIPEKNVSVSRPDNETGIWLKSDRSILPIE